MRTRFDQLGKGIFGQVGQLLGQVRTQYELPGEVQSADLVFWPHEDRALEQGDLGLIGRMLAAPCMLECFHDAPGLREARACLARLFNLHRHLERQPGALAGAPRAGAVRCWIVSAGRPESVLRSLECKPMGESWPAGFWTAPELLCTNIVVVRDLPEERDTLLLRLVGAGRTLARALKQLNALPPEAWEVELVRPMLLAFRFEVAQDPGEDAMEYMDELDAFVNRWKQEAKEEGRVEGRLEGRVEGRLEGRRDTLHHSLLAVYRARFGQEPAALAAALRTAGVDALERWLPLFATGTRDEIARAVRNEAEML